MDEFEILLQDKLNMSEQKSKVYSYYLKNFISNSFLNIIFLFIALYLSLFLEYIIVSVSLMLFRQLLGGVHFESNIRCFIVSLAALIFIFISDNYFIFDEVTLSIIYFICLLIVIIYAPKGTYLLPITNKKKAIQKKKKSVIIILSIWIINLFFINHYTSYVIYSLIVTCIFILPITYKIFKVAEFRE